MTEDPCLHGVRVRGGRALTGEPGAPFDRTLSLTRVVVQPVARVPLNDEFACQRNTGLEYSFGWEDGHWLLRFLGACEFKIAPDTLDMQLTMDPSEELEIGGMLFVNAVLSAVLGLHGAVVLHAGAVAFEKNALLIAGPSGVGKTTLTTVLCAAGAGLVSDDAVRLEHSSSVMAFPGTSELRIRANTEPLISALPWPRRRLADERLATTPMLCRHMTEVRAIWLPRIESVAEPTTRAVRGAGALLALTSALRVAWTPPFAARLLGSLQRIAQAIPIVEVVVPRTLIHDVEQQAALVLLARRCLAAGASAPDVPQL
jgi:hypothetical protein